MLNTLHLRTFLTVVDSGNYSSAAERLHMSQPAISMHIRALEEQLGDVRLFRRVGQRMMLTHAGEELLSAARELIALSDRTEQNIRALRGNITGRVVIGCTPSSGEHLLPILLSVFFMQYPDVRIEIHVAPTQELLDGLAQQEIGVVLMEEQHRRRRWETFYLGSEQLVLLSPPNFPILQHDQVSPGMLSQYPLLLPCDTSPLRRAINEGLRRRGVILNELHVAIETNSISLLLQGVRNAMGLAFVPTTRIAHENNLHVVQLAGTPLTQEWYALRVKDRNALPAIQALYTFLTSSTALALLAKHGVREAQL